MIGLNVGIKFSTSSKPLASKGSPPDKLLNFDVKYLVVPSGSWVIVIRLFFSLTISGCAWLECLSESVKYELFKVV